MLRIWGASVHRPKKTLATAAISDDIVAVRHDLPHMPSLGVSSLNSRPPWQRGGLLFSPVPLHFAICALRSTVLRCSICSAFPAPHPDCPHSAASGPPPGCRQVPAPAPWPPQAGPPVAPATVPFGQSCAHQGRAPGRSQSEPHGPVGGRAEMLGDIAPSEWLIAADAIARALEARFQHVNVAGAALAPYRSPSTISVR